jgi:hypothetical protein
MPPRSPWRPGVVGHPRSSMKWTQQKSPWFFQQTMVVIRGLMCIYTYICIYICIYIYNNYLLLLLLYIYNISYIIYINKKIGKVPKDSGVTWFIYTFANVDITSTLV